MKKITFYLVFFLICAFLVFPPIFVSPAEAQIPDFKITYFKIALFILSLCIFWYFEYSSRKYSLNLTSLILESGKIFLYFGILITVNTVITLTVFLITKDVSLSLSVEKYPVTFLLVAVNFLISAFYEESLYRLYLPVCLRTFAEESYNVFFKVKKSEVFRKRYFIFVNVSVEILCVAVFALSHIYTGWITVLNAAIAGAVLRFAAVKNKTILIGTISHFLYNLFIFTAAVLL